MYDIIILGAGTAGLSAGIYGVRAGLKVLIIEKNFHGGQILNTPEVENYPGLEKISGFDFVMNIYNHAVNLGVEIVYETVESFDIKSDVKIFNTNNKTYQSKTIIIANGASHRELECDGEQEFKGKGVSYCATCDGAFYKNKTVCVVGGGNTALEDALFLSNSCKKVYLIHRRDEFRATKIIVESVLKRDNIEILYNKSVRKITGENTVSNVELMDNIKKITSNIKVDGVFVAIGLDPHNEMFKGIIDIDNSGYIIAGEDCKTNISGVFVAGDTRTKNVRQLITAAADGAVSATEASNYINKI